jgi:hypothetical protein
LRPQGGHAVLVRKTSQTGSILADASPAKRTAARSVGSRPKCMCSARASDQKSCI